MWKQAAFSLIGLLTLSQDCMYKKPSTHITTHQTAPTNTHRFRLCAAGCTIEDVTKVVVEVMSQGQAAELTGVGTWQDTSPVNYFWKNNRR